MIIESGDFFFDFFVGKNFNAVFFEKARGDAHTFDRLSLKLTVVNPMHAAGRGTLFQYRVTDLKLFGDPKGFFCAFDIAVGDVEENLIVNAIPDDFRGNSRRRQTAEHFGTDRNQFVLFRKSGDLFAVIASPVPFAVFSQQAIADQNFFHNLSPNLIFLFSYYNIVTGAVIQMEKTEIVSLYGKKVVLNIKTSDRPARKINIAGGHLYLTLKKGYSLKATTEMLTKVFDEKKIDRLHSSPFVTDAYVDILGVRRRLVNLSLGQKRISKEDFVVVDEEDLDRKIKSLALDILRSRVEKHRKRMNIPVGYDVKITNMRACMGKNYYVKHLLTFDRILIHFSTEIIDSVVIHELTHHFVQNHSDEFYRILLTYCPDYRRLREKLIYGERA